jgi:hypothetical protein
MGGQRCVPFHVIQADIPAIMPQKIATSLGCISTTPPTDTGNRAKDDHHGPPGAMSRFFTVRRGLL